MPVIHRLDNNKPFSRRVSHRSYPGGNHDDATSSWLGREGRVRSEAGAAGAGLAARAGVGGPVHERVAPDRRAAPQASKALPAVYSQ